MHNEDRLPTWNDIVHATIASLTTARESLGNARDHLHSDWRPVGSTLSDEQAAARIAAGKLIAEAKGLIDQAKAQLYEAER
ncbi:hypothetical protein [Prauserella muralis]|uniref:Uncharacterized protein n=1 Tax=Prauserella muralis TaxID=588067 RepID=A0A2V4APM8_9PSEU|nr:hypothetical protein [Prauserella muralis]PXY16621.1 hypothetical protein BAY60_36130 [Prauserella muralis]TWE11129.1 hypothetical protein FHX69_7348 [Prauserella muralis]